MRSRLLAGAAGLALFALAGCTSVATSVPAQPVLATPEPPAPPTPVDVPASPTQVSATATAASTATAIATATATMRPATATASPTSTPAGYWPLDGAPLQPGERAVRRPIVAKIDNHPNARPPTGLSLADVVVEAPAEGGITRFDAVFQHDLPKMIGPIRSARLIDFGVVPWFDGIFLHVGASDPIMAKLRDSGLTDVDQVFNGDLYWRSSDREAPYNVYTDPASILAYADRIGAGGPTDVGSLKFYHGDTPVQSGDRPGPSVRINYSPAVQTAYVYDADRKLYLRSIGGSPHLDAATGKQIAAANVVVMETNVAETDIVEDSLGNRSLQIDTVGEGEVTIFRDGRAMSGYWRRPTRDAMITFSDTKGQPILLKPGQTWIQIIPSGMPFTN